MDCCLIKNDRPMQPTDVYCIIVAAGSGSRFGGQLPKQFCDLAGRPVVMHTIDNVRMAIPGCRILLVVSESMIPLWEEQCSMHSFESPKIVIGGRTRWESVRNALMNIEAAPESTVLVHDAARPLFSPAVAGRLLASIDAGCDGVVPGVAVTDSMRAADPSTGHYHAVDRSKYRAIQTPQAFPLHIIKEAYSRPYEPTMTDDASVCEYAGFSDIRIVEGDHRTLKITHPADLATVAYYLSVDEPSAQH